MDASSGVASGVPGVPCEGASRMRFCCLYLDKFCPALMIRGSAAQQVPEKYAGKPDYFLFYCRSPPCLLGTYKLFCTITSFVATDLGASDQSGIF